MSKDGENLSQVLSREMTYREPYLVREQNLSLETSLGLRLPTWPGLIPVFPPLPLVLQESEGGLYICMNTFLGFGKQYVERHFNKTGQRVYLHLRRTRRPVGMGWAGPGDILARPTGPHGESVPL